MNTESLTKIIVNVDRPAHRGLFIGRHEGKIVMISGPTMPGETVEVNIEEDKKDYFTASVHQIIEPSPDRVEPPCKYFGICGGCRYQHIPYTLQVKMKEDILRDSLRRLANIEADLEEPIMHNSPWNYRLRAQFSVSPDGVGFHRRGTNEVIPVDSCLIMNREINSVIPAINKVIRNYRIKELHLTGSNTLIAKVITRKKALTDADAEQLASALMDCGIAGIYIFVGDNPPLYFGNPYLTLKLLDLKYMILPPSFVQCNWEVNTRVVEFLSNYLQPLQGKKILDLFAGAGNFSLPLAENADVTAVEGNANAIESGRQNVQINDIEHYRFVTSPAEKFRPDEHFDILILDPPRPGLRKKLIKRVLSLAPDKIVYISCNPATFSRDLKHLSEKYVIESVRMIDFFPQTFHIESLAFLRLK